MYRFTVNSGENLMSRIPPGYPTFPGHSDPFGADFEAALAAIRLPSGTAFDDGGLLGLFRHPDASLKK